jgi:hypothetical protein
MIFENFKEMKVHIMVFCIVTQYSLVVVINRSQKNTISVSKIEPPAKFHEKTIILMKADL